MSKHTSGPRSGVGEKVKPELKSASGPRAGRAAKSPMVSLQSLYAGKMIVLADTVPSGTRYVFPSPGSVVSVNAEDVNGLLARKRKQSGCCGGGRVEQPFFRLA